MQGQYGLEKNLSFTATDTNAIYRDNELEIRQFCIAKNYQYIYYLPMMVSASLGTMA